MNYLCFILFYSRLTFGEDMVQTLKSNRILGDLNSKSLLISIIEIF